jgi:hypothetical protein
MGLVAIAARLNELGVTPPRHYKSPAKAAQQWGPTTIGKILRAERYTGKGRYGPEDAAYPPIIDDLTFLAAGRALRRRKQFNKGGTKHDYLLQHIARCKACGSTCTPGHQGRNRLVAYTCNGWARGKNREAHGRYRWYARDIEPQVTEWVLAAVRDPKALLREVELYQQGEFERVEERAQEADMAEARLRELDGEEQRVIEWARKGYIEEASMLAQIDQVKAERKELHERIQAIQQEAYDYDPTTLSADFREWAVEYLSSAMTEEQVPDFLKRWVRAVWLDAEGGVTVEGVLPTGEELTQIEGSSQRTSAQIAGNLFPPS